MELISRETIKPSAPTPPYLKIYPLSFIDQIVSSTYVPVIFFYGPNQVCNQTSKILMLKESLSRVLSKYYPFAGRLNDKLLSIDCNDQGVSLLITRRRGKLSQILDNPTEALLNPLFPDEKQWKQISPNECLLAIQINCFACEGMAISVCLGHKAGDAATLFNFVTDWATMNRKPSEGRDQLPSPPVLDAVASVFPQQQRDLPVFPEVVLKDKTVCRRFVFEGSKIESLKAMVSSHNVQNPTRIEVVTALIYKCVVSALGLSFKTTPFRFVVNIRRRMVPPLPDKSVGNMFWFLYVINPFVEDKETELHDLVRKMKQDLSEFCAKSFGGKDKDLSFILSECPKQGTSSARVHHHSGMENQTLIKYSSWSRFAIYDVDFGWGKPIWVTTSGCPARNMVFLMDARDGKGIEALVNMEEQDMVKFERDVEVLQYASLNPTVTC